MKTTEEAVLELSQTQQEALLRTFGLHETGLRHIDCPFCGKKNEGGDGCRINYTDKLGGIPQYSSICAGCGPRGIMNMLNAVGADLMAINREIGFKYGEDRNAEPTTKKPTTQNRLIELFKKSSRPIRESEPAIAYFHNRGIFNLPGSCVRFIPQLTYWHLGQSIGKYDAIISCATNALGRPSYMHITYIQDGKKVDLGSDKPARKMHSLVANGLKPRCSIKFANRAPEILAVAEGIESALSYEELYKMPSEATLNAGLLEEYRPPEYVKELHIAYDNDKKWTGQAAAHKLLNAVACQCPWVQKVVMRGSSETKTDFNDVLLDGLGVDEFVWLR